MRAGGHGGRLRGVLGCPWGTCPCIHPSVCRSTRSTPSTRSCSSCCGGVRSSIACSARSCTASSEQRPRLECPGAPRHLLEPPSCPPPCPCREPPQPPDSGLCRRRRSRTCAFGEYSDNKVVCVCMFARVWASAPPSCPHGGERVGGRTGSGARQTWRLDLYLPWGSRAGLAFMLQTLELPHGGGRLCCAAAADSSAGSSVWKSFVKRLSLTSLSCRSSSGALWPHWLDSQNLSVPPFPGL